MGMGALREKQLIRFQNSTFRLEGRLPDRRWHLVDLETGLMDQKSDDDLLSAYERHELRFISDDQQPPTGVKRRVLETAGESAEPVQPEQTAESRDEAAKRLQYVRAIKGMKGNHAIKQAIAKAWERIGWPTRPPARSSVVTWARRARAASDPVAALKSHHERKGHHGDRYSSTLADLAVEVIEEHYLCANPRITVAKTLEKLQDAVRLRNARQPKSEALPIPGRRVVEREIARYPQDEVLTRRFGSDVCRKLLRCSAGGVQTTRPLERAEVDHTPLSVILLDDDDLMPWGRPSASLAFDCDTHVPTGAYFGPEVPSIVSVARCIRSSVTPKIEFLKRYPEVRGSWDCFGVHDVYAVDNGLEEHATALRQACSELGGSWVEFEPRKMPWFKPRIERYLRHQDQDFLHTLPATTRENLLQRPDFNPRKDIVLTRRTFAKIYYKWLVDVYMRKPQASLGNLSPIDAWRKRIGLADQFVPSRVVLLERLFLRRVSDRRLDHEGIEFDCLIYNSSALGLLRSQLGAVLTVTIWVSDEDLGHIYVEVPNQDVQIRVPCLNLKYAEGLTRWQHSKCKKMKRVNLDEGRELSLAEARDEIMKLIQADAQELKQARRKMRSRFKERERTDGSRPPEPNEDQLAERRARETSSVLRDRERPAPQLRSFLAGTRK